MDNEDYDSHVLLKHGDIVLSDFPRTFNEIKLYLEPLDIEGVVWHHPDDIHAPTLIFFRGIPCAQTL